MSRFRSCALGALVVSLVGCGGSEDSTSGGSASGGSGAGGPGSGGAVFGTGFGGSGAGGGAGTGGPGSGAPFDECVGETSGVEGRPLDMYVVLDHTNSMGEDCPLSLTGAAPPSSTKWCFATHALAQYFTSPDASGIRAALQFMTVEDYVCTGGPDNGEARAEVGLTLLPVDGSHALVTALDADSPEGGLGTRIEAALHGIATFTAAEQIPSREMIGILITDGDPNGCEEDVDILADIISAHLDATGIRTFVIGMTGATLSNLEALAVAGGAPAHGPEFCGGPDSCHYWSVGDGDPVAFVDALRQIQAAASIPCEYLLPEPPPGDEINPDLVNMTYDPVSGETVVIPRVTAAADCAGGEGWYYDTPSAPSSIHLCEATCEAVTGATSGDLLHVSYGCESVTVDIR